MPMKNSVFEPGGKESTALDTSTQICDLSSARCIVIICRKYSNENLAYRGVFLIVLLISNIHTSRDRMEHCFDVMLIKYVFVM